MTQPSAKPALNVFVGASRAGVIHRSAEEHDSFLFSYENDCPRESAVSLTMPVGPEQIDSMGGLLPIFEMNLPEGVLRERLRKDFAKAIPNFDDLDLLAIVGESQIGRLRYSHQLQLSDEIPAQSIAEILTYRGVEDLFEDLLRRFARYSGVSGMQPKVLLRDSASNDERLPERVTHVGATHIVKSFDPREFPELAANELLCTQGAQAAGIHTPRLALAENRKMLIVERFDRLPGGEYLGVEDFCVLDSRRSHGRYDGSYEHIARRIGQFVSAKHRSPALEQFALMVAYACATENGDAHLKNFSVLYEHTSGEVRLAPAYDLVCTTAYMPRDTLALTLNGSKRFPERAELLKFIRSIASVTPARAAALLEQAAQGVLKAVDAALAMGKEQSVTRRFIEAYVQALNRGIDRSFRDSSRTVSLPSRGG